MRRRALLEVYRRNTQVFTIYSDLSRPLRIFQNNGLNELRYGPKHDQRTLAILQLGMNRRMNRKTAQNILGPSRVVLAYA